VTAKLGTHAGLGRRSSSSIRLAQLIAGRRSPSACCSGNANLAVQFSQVPSRHIPPDATFHLEAAGDGRAVVVRLGPRWSKGSDCSASAVPLNVPRR